MLKVGDTITVRYSKKLAQNGNSLLVNRTGKVTRVLTSNGEVVGVRADVTVMRKTRNFYIPVSSIDGSDEINRMMSLNILKSTIL